jgi:hypothetical protein
MWLPFRLRLKATERKGDREFGLGIGARHGGEAVRTPTDRGARARAREVRTGSPG